MSGATAQFRRKLDREDLLRMNLPEEFWRARIEQVPESVRKPVARYLHKIDFMYHECVGLFLTGGPGVGKTGIASLVLKEARSRGFTAYFISLWELRELIRSRVMFDDDTSIFGRCREVDFLVLDGLREEDATEKFLGPKEIEELIRYRGSRRRPTLITTQFSIQDLQRTFPSLLASTKGIMVQFPVKGPDRHQERREKITQALFEEQ